MVNGFSQHFWRYYGSFQATIVPETRAETKEMIDLLKQFNR